MDAVKDAGIKKVLEACRAAISLSNVGDLVWVWIDTVCIDKTNNVELSEAINSIYRWYSKSLVCLVYLEDVQLSSNAVHYTSSEWFGRGWTLQELIAPGQMLFMTADGP